jgi:hypothetical protein
MIIIWIVCRISSMRSSLTYLWSIIRKLWSWKTRMTVSSFKRIMKLSWIFHVRIIEIQEQKRASTARSMSSRKQRRRRRWKKKEREEETKQKRKKFFWSKKERACSETIECEWFDQALIAKRWNLQTVNDVEKKSIVQLMLSSVERFLWISHWLKYEVELMMFFSEEERII